MGSPYSTENFMVMIMVSPVVDADDYGLYMLDINYLLQRIKCGDCIPLVVSTVEYEYLITLNRYGYFEPLCTIRITIPT